MSIFSILDFEPEVQVNDKTRLDASKCFSSKGSVDVSSLTIKPELSGSEIDCFDPSAENRYLDWVYSNLSIDVNASNYTLIFNEGGEDISSTLTPGTYTLTSYANALATLMTSDGTQEYSASYSFADSKFTISAAASFEFKKSSVATQSFFKLGVSNTSHISDTVEYGNKIITVVSSNGTDTDTNYYHLKAYSVDGDRLFCSDGDLIAHEPDIMKWVQDGRASYKNVYRRAQKLIIAWIDEKGYVNSLGGKYDKHDIIDIEEVRQWATFMSLRLIFQGMSNAIDDIFDRKSKIYDLNEQAARQRVVLRLDSNKDGIADLSESISIYSGSLFRR